MKCQKDLRELRLFIALFLQENCGLAQRAYDNSRLGLSFTMRLTMYFPSHLPPIPVICLPLVFCVSGDDGNSETQGEAEEEDTHMGHIKCSGDKRVPSC